MKKKIALISLILILVFSLTTVANAAMYSSAYISDCAAQAQRSSGKVTLTFDIVGKEVMDVIGAQTIIFQEKAPGSTQWTAVATMTSDNYPSMLSYNTRQHISSVYYSSAKSGYSYRAKIYFYAEKGGYDTKEYITSAV